VGFGMGPGMGYERPIEETVVNNYYDSPGGEHGEHHLHDGGGSGSLADDSWSEGSGNSYDSGSDFGDSGSFDSGSGSGGDDGGF
jgi:hypothetical protein